MHRISQIYQKMTPQPDTGVQLGLANPHTSLCCLRSFFGTVSSLIELCIIGKCSLTIFVKTSSDGMDAGLLVLEWTLLLIIIIIAVDFPTIFPICHPCFEPLL